MSWKNESPLVKKSWKDESPVKVDPAQPGVQAIGSNEAPIPLPTKEPTTEERREKALHTPAEPLNEADQFGDAGEVAGRAMNMVESPFVMGAAQVASALKSYAQGRGWKEGAKIITPEDEKRMLHGEGPGVSEMAHRMGVPSGPEFDIMGNKIRPADIAMDTVGGAALSPFSYMGAAARPAGEVLQGAGKTVYKSGLKKVEERIAEKGKTGLGEDLLENGITGSAKSVASQTKGVMKETKSGVDAVLKQAEEKGAKVDMVRATKEAQDLVDHLKKTANPQDAGLQKTIQVLQDKVNEYKTAPSPTPSQATEWKTMFNSNAGDQSFQEAMKTPLGKQFEKAMGSGHKAAVEESVGATLGKEAQDQVASQNASLGRMIDAQKPLKMQARRETTPNWISPIDATLLAYAAHDPVYGLPVFAAKKLADYAKTTHARTNVGYLLNRAGKTGVPDALLRQGVAESMSQNPWEKPNE